MRRKHVVAGKRFIPGVGILWEVHARGKAGDMYPIAFFHDESHARLFAEALDGKRAGRPRRSVTG